MKDAGPDEATGAGVPSPCISLCVMDGNRRYCQGCRRTLGEIAAWRGLSDDEKRAVLAQLPMRR